VDAAVRALRGRQHDRLRSLQLLARRAGSWTDGNRVSFRAVRGLVAAAAASELWWPAFRLDSVKAGLGRGQELLVQLNEQRRCHCSSAARVQLVACHTELLLDLHPCMARRANLP